MKVELGRVSCAIGGPSQRCGGGLVSLLLAAGATVVGEARTLADIDTLLRSSNVDVVLSCFEPLGLAISLVRRLPTTPVLILSSSAERTDIVETFRAGARGLLPMEAADDELLAAVRDVAAGRLVLPRGSENLLVELMQQGGVVVGYEERLTTREREVVKRLTEGRSNRQIAQSLGLAEQTVKNQLSKIMLKVGVFSRTELCRWATDHGLHISSTESSSPKKEPHE